MGGLKTLLGTLLFLTLSLQATPTRALSADEQLRMFAGCAGRLSAQMEHQWMFDGPASEDTKAARETVLDILDAILPPDRGRDVLNWRIDAKIAHAALLTRATFGKDEADKAWALKLATERAANCTAFLLG